MMCVELTQPSERSELQFAARQLAKAGIYYEWRTKKIKKHGEEVEKWSIWIYLQPRKDAQGKGLSVMEPVTRTVMLKKMLD